MDDGLVEPGAPTSGLIDNVGGNPATHEIGLPAFAPIRCRLQTCSCMTGPVHHDDRRCVVLLAVRYLELHIHLADHDLVGIARRWVGAARGGVVGLLGDLGPAPVEELPWALVNNGLGRNFFGLWVSCPGTVGVLATSRTA